MPELRLWSRLVLIPRTDYCSLHLTHWMIPTSAASYGLVVRYQRNGELEHSSGLLCAAFLSPKRGPPQHQPRCPKANFHLEVHTFAARSAAEKKIRNAINSMDSQISELINQSVYFS